MPQETKQGFALTQIFDNIPIPAVQKRTRTSPHRFEDLEVGQSFFIAEGNIRNVKNLCRLHNRKNEGTKEFICDRYTLEGIEGIMVWRTA